MSPTTWTFYSVALDEIEGRRSVALDDAWTCVAEELLRMRVAAVRGENETDPTGVADPNPYRSRSNVLGMFRVEDRQSGRVGRKKLAVPRLIMNGTGHRLTDVSERADRATERARRNVHAGAKPPAR